MVYLRRGSTGTMVIFEKFFDSGGLKTALSLLAKYKYVLLVAAVGVILLMWPAEKEITAETAAPASAAGVSEPDTEREEARIASALAAIEGAGRVEVVLTLKSSAEMQLAVDSENEYLGADGEPSDSRTETVIVASSDGGESPVAVKYSCAEYRGALVVCEGADRADVRLSVTQAVSALTGLGTDKITIAKMKNEG